MKGLGRDEVGRGLAVGAAVLGVLVVNQLVGHWLMGVLQPSEERFPSYFCHPALSFNMAFLGGWIPLPSWGERWIPAVAAAFGLALLGWWLMRGIGRGRMIASAFVGGALLNGLVDRVTYGSSVTFALCRGFGDHVFAFNAADAGFLLGAAWWLMDVLGRRFLLLISSPGGHFRKL